MTAPNTSTKLAEHITEVEEDTIEQLRVETNTVVR